MSKRLVTYFFASGVTAKVAENLADAIGADIFEIQLKVSYTKADLNWMDKKVRSTIEMSDPASRPAIAAKRDNIAEYDTIFVGYSSVKYRHIRLYEHNAFTSHLMLDSDEVYQMTKRRLDAAQIAAAKGIHLNLVLVKLLELHHLGYDLRHYHAQHHAFIKHLRLPAYFRFDTPQIV